MDREFLGENWLQWLDKKGIDYVLRIKKNTLIGDKNADQHGSTPGPKMQERQSIWGLPLYFSHKKISKTKGGDLFVVSNRFKGKEALELYRKRWGIELLFSHLKRRGFNLEDTHLKDKKKLERLMAVVSVSFLYSYGWGLHLRKTIKQNSFTRRQSDFRYGLNSILSMIWNPRGNTDSMNDFLEWIDTGTLETDL